MAATQWEMGGIELKDLKTMSIAAMLLLRYPFNQILWAGWLMTLHRSNRLLISDLERKQTHSFSSRILYSWLQCLQGLNAYPLLIPGADLS